MRKKKSFLLPGLIQGLAASLMVSLLLVSTVRATGDRLPEPRKILFWTPQEQNYGYRNMELIFPYHTVSAGKSGSPSPLPQGRPLEVRYAGGNAGTYMERNHVVGLLVLSEGRIVLEKYRQGFTPDQRWTSFSMAKSVTSLMVGAAVKEGLIRVDDRVCRYLPELAEGSYAKVTVRQLLTMTSGVAWSENYTDPDSDVSRLSAIIGNPKASLLQYMADLPRAAPPGSVFNYSTGEDMIIGELLCKVTGKSLAAYLSEKIWSRLPMEKDAVWVVNAHGHEVSGAMLSATLRDYGRIGLFALQDGRIGNERILPKEWMKESTTAGEASRERGSPYGYQWWVNQDGSYEAGGIFGQMIHVDPERKSVIVILSAWPEATGSVLRRERAKFVAAVRAALKGQAAL